MAQAWYEKADKQQKITVFLHPLLSRLDLAVRYVNLGTVFEQEGQSPFASDSIACRNSNRSSGKGAKDNEGKNQITFANQITGISKQRFVRYRYPDNAQRERYGQTDITIA